MNSPMAITFRVDDVTPAATPPPTVTLAEHLGAALAIGGDAGLRSQMLSVGLPAELRALYDACGGARLFGTWRLRPLAEHQQIDVAGCHVTRFLDLPDGTFLAFAIWREPVFVRLRSDALSTLTIQPEMEVGGIDEVTGLPIEERPNMIHLLGGPAARSSEARDSIPVVGKSIAAILAEVLCSDGATELPAVSTLIDALPEWARLR